MLGGGPPPQNRRVRTPYPTMPGTFQVDLRGLVDLLSRHLYRSPDVYVRELLQNAVDAVDARRRLEPGVAGAVEIEVVEPAHGAPEVIITDNGIGLTGTELVELLATIGRSSKRGDLSPHRDYIGQFGIGLLACFVVADEITVVTRSAKDPDAMALRWQGRADGSYDIAPVESALPVGTRVHLRARPGAEHRLSRGHVLRLTHRYGGLLPLPVRLGSTVVNDELPPWELPALTMDQERENALSYARRVLDLDPLDAIPLHADGVRGLAFVLPYEPSPAARQDHRVYLRRMLLSDSVDRLLPDWAFFVRCVVDAESLRPTASRESLYEDDTLAAVRDALAERLRDWIARAAASDPELLGRFLQAHHLAVKSLAVHDDEILRMLLPWLPFETTDGHCTLDEFARTHPTVLVTASVEEFRQVAAIASAAGLGVVNGGYTYDRELVHRLPEIRPEATVADLDPATLTAHLDPVDRETELAASAYLAQAREALAVFDCDVALRTFHPASAPALLVDSREARHERTRSQLAREQQGGVWGDILGALRQEAPRAQLILNQLNPLVRTAVTIDEPELARTSAEALYGQAAMLSRRPLRPAESSLINRSFLDLLAHALRKDS